VIDGAHISVRALNDWHTAPTAPAFEPDEVQIWQVPLANSAPESAWRILAHDEIAAARRFHFDRDRDRYVSCRAELRRLLSSATSTPAEKIRLACHPYGKPYLAENPHGLRFNVSHSIDIALIAIAMNSEVGVDIERINPDVDHHALAARFFTPAERQFLATVDIAAQQEAFYHCWTRKEAWMKAVGCGLSRPLEQFDVASSLGNPITRVHQPQDRTTWLMLELRPEPQTIGALVVEPTINTVRLWR
jgi:4'-phosphopantetheinyl transferase